MPDRYGRPLREVVRTTQEIFHTKQRDRVYLSCGHDRLLMDEPYRAQARMRCDKCPRSGHLEVNGSTESPPTISQSIRHDRVIVQMEALLTDYAATIQKWKDTWIGPEARSTMSMAITWASTAVKADICGQSIRAIMNHANQVGLPKALAQLIARFESELLGATYYNGSTNALQTAVNNEHGHAIAWLLPQLKAWRHTLTEGADGNPQEEPE